MTISVGFIKKLILKFIGGVKLMPVPTVKIGGVTAVTQMGGLAGLAASFAGGALGGLASALSGGGLSGLVSQLSGGLTDQFSSLQSQLGSLTAGLPSLSEVGQSLTGALGGNIGGLEGLTSKLDGLNVDVESFSNILGDMGSITTITDMKEAISKVGGQVQIGELSDIGALNTKLQNIGVDPSNFGDLSELSNLGKLSDTLSNMGVASEFNFGDFSGITASIPTQVAPVDMGNFGALVEQAGGLNGLAKSLATGTISLDQTLSTLTTNPVSPQITSTKTTLSSLTASNYSGLDSTLSSIAGNGALAPAYQQLKLALGGPDGLSGSVAYVNAFEDHTNRLAGVTLSSDVTGIIPEEENTEIFEYKFDIPLNQQTVIAHFNPQKIRSAKFFVQATSNIDHQSSEIFVVHDNQRVYTREVDVIYTHDPFVTFTSEFTASNVTILATSTKVNTDMVIHSIRLPVITKANSDHTFDQGKIIDNARAMVGFFPEDNVDYIATQSGSLTRSNTVSELNTQINEALVKLQSSEFTSLSTENKKTYINNIASAINTKSVSLQQSIDSDLTAYSELENIINAADVVSTLVVNYASVDTKRLFDATIKAD